MRQPNLSDSGSWSISVPSGKEFGFLTNALPRFARLIGYDGPMLRATITFLRTEDGGRRGLITTGYRPQFHFGDDIYEARIEVFPERWVNPSESTDANFTLTDNSTERLRGRIEVGHHFELREGSRLVATGTVTAIENQISD